MSDAARSRVLELVRRFGHATTSFQVLESGFRYAMFDGDRCVAYVDTGGAWVAAGAPLSDDRDLAATAEAFVVRARNHGRRAVFFATESRFASAVPEMAHLLVGQQPIFDPTTWDETLKQAKSLREQLRRATAKDVRVERVPADGLAIGTPRRAALDDLVSRWLRARSMATMGFVVQIELADFFEHRRAYAAWRGESLVGFLGLVPIFARRGWFFEDLLRDPCAPNGTSELLVDHAMRDLANEDARHATFGLAPLSGTVAPWLARARRWGRPLYDFEGLQAFKQKLRPTDWSPVYLSYAPGTGVVRAVVDVLTAFSRRGLLRFALATFLRGPNVVVGLLAGLLVPWTLGLAVVDGATWFGARWIQASWVTFDVVLALVLAALGHRWRPRLATLVAALVTLDAGLTLLQIVVWNLPRIRNAGDVALVTIAFLAPAISAVVLWNARARHALR